MNNSSVTDRREVLVRRIGLAIATVALLALFVLAAYRVPLFSDELNGTIVGISEIHDEAGSELVAAVQLDSGAQVLVSMPRDLLKSQSNSVRINEWRTFTGRRTYSIITHNE